MNSRVEQRVERLLNSHGVRDRNALKSMSEFMVLWNKLEHRHGNHINPGKLRRAIKLIIDESIFKFENYSNMLDFFIDRYQKRPRLFHTLVRDDAKNVEKEFAESLLELIKDKELGDQETFEGIIAIPYRIRNNLFHGRKGTEHILKQADLFDQTNLILCQFHDDLTAAGIPE